MKKGIRILKKHKLLVSLILVILMSMLTYISYKQALLKAAKLVEIPVTSKYLKSNTLITKEDITYITLPAFVILDNVETDSNNIIGKYINTFDALGKNSLFYKDIIIEATSIDNAYLFDLKNNEVAISIDADVKSSYANSILVGQLIDLYFIGNLKTNFLDNTSTNLVYGQIVKNARVIAVKDKNGDSINAESELDTNVVVVALSQEDANIVELAKNIGEVNLVISYDNINEKTTNDYYDIDKIRKLISQQAIDVSNIVNKEELINEGN